MASSPIFPFYAGLWNGFFNRAFYADVAMRWRIKGFAFLALVVVLYAIPTCLIMLRTAGQFVEEELPFILPQVPAITLEGGLAHADQGAKGEPIYLKTREGRVIAEIDTQNEASLTDMPEGVAVFITKETLYVRATQDVIQIQWRDYFKDGVIDRRSLEEASQSILGWVGFFTLTVMPAMHYLLLLLNALLYSLAGMAFARRYHLGLGYGSLYQLVLVAQGCALLVVLALRLVAWMLGVTPTSWVTEMLLVMFFVWYSIRLTREWVEQEERHLPPPSKRF